MLMAFKKFSSNLKNYRIMKTSLVAKNTVEQSIVEIFIEEMDKIYYPGYSEELIGSEPDKFDWELAEYKGQFSKEYVN
jgi:hypothetical protein